MLDDGLVKEAGALFVVGLNAADVRGRLGHENVNERVERLLELRAGRQRALLGVQLLFCEDRLCRGAEGGIE